MNDPVIIYEDNSIIVINKPAGLASQTANISQKDCVTVLKSHLKKSNPSIKGEPYLGIIHRLDQPVEGLMVFAKNKKTAGNLSEQFKSSLPHKTYLAMVEGILDIQNETTLENYLIKDSIEKRAHIVDTDNSNGIKTQKAILSYHTISVDIESNTSILQISLVTGRFHQIRAQLSHLNHPIVGDKKYLSTMNYEKHFLTGEAVNRGAIALIAVSLEVPGYPVFSRT